MNLIKSRETIKATLLEKQLLLYGYIAQHRLDGVHILARDYNRVILALECHVLLMHKLGLVVMFVRFRDRAVARLSTLLGCS